MVSCTEVTFLCCSPETVKIIRTVTQWLIDCTVQNISWKMAGNGHVKLNTPSPFPFHKIPPFSSVVLFFRQILRTIFPKFISKLHSIVLKSVLCTEVKYNSKEFPVCAMKAYGGVNSRIHLYFGRGECLGSRFGRYILGQNASGSHWIGGWLTPQIVWTF